MVAFRICVPTSSNDPYASIVTEKSGVVRRQLALLRSSKSFEYPLRARRSP